MTAGAIIAGAAWGAITGLVGYGLWCDVRRALERRHERCVGEDPDQPGYFVLTRSGKLIDVYPMPEWLEGSLPEWAEETQFDLDGLPVVEPRRVLR